MNVIFIIIDWLIYIIKTYIFFYYFYLLFPDLLVCNSFGYRNENIEVQSTMRESKDYKFKETK